MKALASLIFCISVSFIMAQDCSTAEACYEEALKKPFDEQKAYLEKAWKLIQQDSGAEDFNKANILVVLAAAYANEGNLDKGFELLAQTREIYPYHVDIYLYEHQFYLRGKKDSVKAVATLMEGLEVGVEHPVYLQKELGKYYASVGDLEKALEWYTNAQKGIPYTLMRGVGEDAVYAINNGDITIAGNDRAEIHYQKADLRRQLAEGYEYVTDLNLAIKENPHHAFARYWRGAFYYRNDMDNKAREDLLVFREDYPENHYALMCLGDIAYRQKNWAEASNNYLDAHKIRDTDMKALYFGTRALWQYAYTNQEEWSKYYDTIVNNMKRVSYSNGEFAEYAKNDLKSLGVSGY